MSNLQTFQNVDFGLVRAMAINGYTWFVAKDVSGALGYDDVKRALLRYVEPEDKMYHHSLFDGGRHGDWLINDAGLYSLVASSERPSAKAFKMWIASMVIPSVRRSASSDGKTFTLDQIGSSPEVLISALSALKAEQDKNNLLRSRMAMPTAPAVPAPAVPAPAVPAPAVPTAPQKMPLALPPLMSTTFISRELKMGVNVLYQKLDEAGVLKKASAGWRFCKKYNGKGYGILTPDRGALYPRWTPMGRELILRMFSKQ